MDATTSLRVPDREDCGEAIDERRLRALPATRFCTACQAIHQCPALRP